MQTGRERAMIACQAMTACHAMTACLSAESARRFADALAAAGFEVAAEAHSAREVLPMLRLHRPRLLLAEAVLPGGDGVSLARDIVAASLDLYPHLLLVLPPRLALPGLEALDDLGAALVDGPPTPGGILDAVAALRARDTRLPPAQCARLQGLLDRLGVPDHPGREMLRGAVGLVWRDRSRLRNLRDRVYPDAARPLGRTGAQAERAIRHVIDAAWRTGEIDEQQRIFGDTIDARRGRPTCSEMIAQLADILRWEG